MDEQDYRGRSAQVETVGFIELPALGDPWEREELSLNEIRRRCGYVSLSQCTVCRHPKCSEIEQAMMTQSCRAVAVKYGVGRTSLERHMHNHFALPE